MSIRAGLLALLCSLTTGCSTLSSGPQPLVGKWSGYATCRNTAKPYLAGIQINLVAAGVAGASTGVATLARKNGPGVRTKHMLFNVEAMRNEGTGVVRLYSPENSNVLFLTVRTEPELATQLCGQKIVLRPGIKSLDALSAEEGKPTE